MTADRSTTGVPRPAPRDSSTGGHPWFTPTGTGNPVTPATTADEEPGEDGGQPTEARPAESSEHS